MAIIIYTTSVTIGGLLVFLGGLENNYILLLIGKVLVSVGGEVLTGAISKEIKFELKIFMKKLNKIIFKFNSKKNLFSI
jgi:hypothetical protein